MRKSQVIKSVEYLYGSFFLPTVLLGKGMKLVYDPTGSGFGAIYQKVAAKAKDAEVSFVEETAGLFGVIALKKAASVLVVGPFVNKTTDASLIDQIIHGYGLPWEDKKRLFGFLSSIPSYSLNRFLSYMALVEFLFNQRSVSMLDYFEAAAPSFVRRIGQRQSEDIVRETNYGHGTHNIEREILSYVRRGDVLGINSLFKKIVKAGPLYEGKLAEDALRQAKNIFIGLVTMIGKAGAIPGNLDIEQTYQLIDLYIQECERCVSINQVNELRYSAVVDFTRRVAELKHPTSYSGEVYKSLQYIKSHTNQPIGAMDVVAQSGKSRSVFMAQFKKETGQSIAQYIRRAKLEEAKVLLAYSDTSLQEISDTLYFSSQPYFQNLFKKEYGITPLQYRKKHYRE